MKLRTISMIFGCVLMAALGTPAAANVGDDACMECHEDTAAAVMKTVHVAANGVSCESCHGSGDAHIEDPMPENIRTFGSLNADEIIHTCGTCHVDMQPIKSSHFGEGKACLNCHNEGHGAAFVESGQVANRNLVNDISSGLCTDCHTDVRTRMNRPYSHPMNDYDNTCVGCHNPHQTRTDMLGQRMNETCATCHPTQNGPFMFEHLGTRNEGCGGCHEPHGSTHPNLLNRHTTQILCISCHTDTPAFHDQADPRYRQCTACHSAIHGSNISHLLME